MRISDWSSDVCSSDLSHSHRLRLPDGAGALAGGARCGAVSAVLHPGPDDLPLGQHGIRRRLVDPGRAQQSQPLAAAGLPPEDRVAGQRGAAAPAGRVDRKSVVWGKSVSVRVDLGGRRIIKKKKNMMMSHVIVN